MTDTNFYTIEDGKFVEIADPMLPAPMAAAGILMSVMRGVLPVAGKNDSHASEPGNEARASVSKSAGA